MGGAMTCAQAVRVVAEDADFTQGPKTTTGNHSFIQRLLENGYDERPLHNKRTPKSEVPTLECVQAVEQILAQV